MAVNFDELLSIERMLREVLLALDPFKSYSAGSQTQVSFLVTEDDDARYVRVFIEGVCCSMMPLPAGVTPLDFLNLVAIKLQNLLSVGSRFNCEKRVLVGAEGPISSTLNLTRAER